MREKTTDFEMRNEEVTLLELIKSSLWKHEFKAIEGIDWEKVYLEAHNHCITTLLVSGLSSECPCDIKEKWKVESYGDIAHFYQIMNPQQQLVNLFNEADIPMCIIKGSSAAMYYPNPTTRTMGDIDIIVPKYLFPEARKLMDKNGFSSRVDADAEVIREVAYFKDGIEYELHLRFSRYSNDIDGQIEQGLRSIERHTIGRYTFPTLPKLANGLVLLAHISYHLHSGLGLRQIIDWMFYVSTELDDQFWEDEFSVAAQEAGLEKLAVVVTYMCKKYLGLSDTVHWCDTADPEICDALMHSLLRSGNFGRKMGNGYKFENVSTNFRVNGIFSYLQYAGECNWKAYKKHHWLKPFAWLYQIGRYARQWKNSKRSIIGVKKDFDESKERYNLLIDLEIEKE